MNDYADLALDILNDSSEHDSTGKFSCLCFLFLRIK